MKTFRASFVIETSYIIPIISILLVALIGLSISLTQKSIDYSDLLGKNLQQSRIEDESSDQTEDVSSELSTSVYEVNNELMQNQIQNENQVQNQIQTQNQTGTYWYHLEEVLRAKMALEHLSETDTKEEANNQSIIESELQTHQ